MEKEQLALWIFVQCYFIDVLNLYHFTLGTVDFTFRDFVSLSYKKVNCIMYNVSQENQREKLNHKEKNEAVLLLLYLHTFK